MEGVAVGRKVVVFSHIFTIRTEEALTTGTLRRTSFWNRGTSDKYSETPRPRVTPQMASVGLKRFNIL